MPNRIKIVSTKKLLTTQKQPLFAANMVLLQSDYISTQPVDFDLLSIKDNLIFTSQNAIKTVINHSKIEEVKHKNVFCVGQKSKDLLVKNDFHVVAYAENADELGELLALVYAHESFTFFGGNRRRDELPIQLKKAKIDFNEIQVYETILTPKKNKLKPNGILFYSPSGVESYLKKNTITDEVCFCIGKTTGKALLKYKVSRIVMPPKPSIENLIETVVQYFQS